MKNLLRKYVDGNLSNSELLLLQKTINSATNDEIAGYLQEFWSEETGESTSNELVITMKKEIDNQIRLQNSRHKNFWKIISRAAAIITVPLLFSIAYYMYKQTPDKPITNMIVSVGSGEHVNIVLPDGTKVNLNAETTLNYDISTFNKKLREVALAGEAYFEVAKNEKIPFMIKTSGLDVKVLGTTFNLSARDKDNLIALCLLKGKVQLHSTKLDENAVLYPNQLAVLDKETGKITISKANNSLSTAWTRGELAFKATPINSVMKEIERCYGVTIKMNMSADLQNDLFTGTFSVKNLNETLEILKLHYRFNYSINGTTVYIDNFKLNKK